MRGRCFTRQPCNVVCACIEDIRDGQAATSQLTRKDPNSQQHPTNMTFNGLLFCTACGNLLPRVSKFKAFQIACDLCDTLTTSTDNHMLTSKLSLTSPDEWPDQTSTSSRPTDYPSALQRKRDRFATLPIPQDIASAQQITNEECPQCHNPEMQFREAQTRGADEGSTISTLR